MLNLLSTSVTNRDCGVMPSQNLAAIAPPAVISAVPPSVNDEFRAAVIQALPILREYIATLDEWEQEDDAVEAMATVDHLARLAEPTVINPVDAEATARLYYANRMHIWDGLTAAQQRERAGLIARALVLTDTPLVEDAASLNKLANGFHVALVAFLTKYERAEAGRMLTAAGLNDPQWRASGENGEWREDRFESIIAAAEEANQVVSPIAAKLSGIVCHLTSYQFGYVEPVRKAAGAA